MFIFNFPHHLNKLYKPDEQIGYALEKNENFEWSFNGTINNIHIGADGFLSQQNSKPADFYIIGDGYCSAFEVSMPESFYGLLNKQHGMTLKNLCVPGYSTVQEFLTLKQYSKNMTVKRVILFFNLDNDVMNNSKRLNSKLSYASLYPYIDKNGIILLPDITLLDKAKHFFSSFRLYSFMAYCKSLLLNNSKQAHNVDTADAYAEDDLLYTAQALKALKNYADATNMQLIIYGVSMNHSALIGKSNKTDAAVKDICYKIGLSYYSNINTAWRLYMQKNIKPSNESEGHPNKIGHILIANDLKNILHKNIKQ